MKEIDPNVFIIATQFSLLSSYPKIEQLKEQYFNACEWLKRQQHVVGTDFEKSSRRLMFAYTKDAFLTGMELYKDGNEVTDSLLDNLLKKEPTAYELLEAIKDFSEKSIVKFPRKKKLLSIVKHLGYAVRCSGIYNGYLYLATYLDINKNQSEIIWKWMEKKNYKEDLK